MEKQTLEKLEAAFEAVEKDLSGRVTELALKSTAGTLSQDEQAEYEHIVRLNDLLSVLKLQTEEYWAPRIASCRWRSPCARGYSSVRSTPANIVACRNAPPCCHIRLIILSPSSIWGPMRRPISASVAYAAI